MLEIAIGVCAAVGFLTIAGAVTLAAWIAVDSLWSRRASKIREEERDRLRSLLIGSSWWFSEHMPTTHLIQNLAVDMDDDQARRLWRKEMAAMGGSDE